jgi:hypothetical protein
VSEVLDTEDQLGYIYEGVAGAKVEMTMSPAPESEPEMVGASESPIELTGTPAAVDVPIDQRAVAARARDAGVAAASPHVYLNIEDIQAEQNPAMAYEVFVAAGDSPGEVPWYVGNVSFFGIEHSSAVRRPIGAEDPHGIRRTFDITGWATRMRDQGTWNEDQIRVSFRPAAAIPPPGAEPEAAGPVPAVRVGRVSVFYQ